MTIENATLDKLLEGVDPLNPQSIFTDAGVFGQLKKRLQKECSRPSSPTTWSSNAIRQSRRVITATAAARSRAGRRNQT